MKPLAIRGTYADWRLVKTRGVVQIVIEVPLSDSGAAFDVMGGMPNPANERWFGIAPLKKEVMSDIQPPIVSDAWPEPRQDKPARAKPKRDWRDILPSNQAGIRCSEPEFAAFLREARPDDWHDAMEDTKECIYLICGITSRSFLDINREASTAWHQLDEQFLTWQALERAS